MCETKSLTVRTRLTDTQKNILTQSKSYINIIQKEQIVTFWNFLGARKLTFDNFCAVRFFVNLSFSFLKNKIKHHKY